MPHEYYKVIWVDSEIKSLENQIYHKMFQELGYTGFQGIESVDKFTKFLDDDLVKDNVLVITSGTLAKVMIPLITAQLRKKVQRIIIFCRSLDYHFKWKESHPKLVLAVTNNFALLTKEFNNCIRQIEKETAKRYEINYSESQSDFLDQLYF